MYRIVDALVQWSFAELRRPCVLGKEAKHSFILIQGMSLAEGR